VIEFRIADTFIDSLTRLTGEEQKAVKTAAFDLQMNPARPSFQLERVVKSKDKNFWSARITLDLRLIVHRSESSLLLCFVQHHDEAYDWARRRKLEVHPTTGAAQLVELREIMQEIVVPRYVGPSPMECEGLAPPKPALFAHIPESDLLAYGVPAEWLPEVRKADEDSLFVLAEHLPVEATEALINLATGAKPRLAPTLSSSYDPFTHPDSERRFRAMRTPEDLERAFTSAWEKWRRPTAVRVPRSRRIQIQNQDDQAEAVLPVCDWVYFATSSPEDFVTTRNIVREFGMIIRTVFNSAGIRIANVQQVRQRDTILLVHGGGRSKTPYRPMFLCTVVAPSCPVPNFDGISFLDESQQERLRNSGYSPDPQLGMFTGISILLSGELEHLECAIPRPLGNNALRRWNEVFGGNSE
jgi:mRNA-degrading endonuclease RelE of RelBE toxin-antitoxin system